MKKNLPLKSCFFKTLVILCSVFLHYNAFAQTEKIETFVATALTKTSHAQQIEKQLQGKFKKYETASLPLAKLYTYLATENDPTKRLMLQAAGHTFRLQLIASDLISNKYKLIVRSNTGEQETSPLYKNAFFKGVENGKSNQQVRFSLTHSFISGYIQQDGEEYFIESLSEYAGDALENEIVVYNAKDVIVNENRGCGYGKFSETLKESVMDQVSLADSASRLGSCRSLKVLLMSDYSMYSLFNKDIDELQLRLFSIINNMQGIFSDFNFEPNSSVDVGTDVINFEIVGLYVSTCPTCDIILSNEIFNQSTSISTTRRWIRTNADTSSPIVSYYFTNKNMTLSSGGSEVPVPGFTWDFFSTCNPARWPLIGCRYAGSVAAIRNEAAHELGHAFGCVHDDYIRPAVTQYIMNSTINPAATAFSSLADFPAVVYAGAPFSSKYYIANKIRALNACVSDCNILACPAVKNLSAKNINAGASIRLSWLPTGNIYGVKIKEKQSAAAVSTLSTTAADSFLVIGNLQPCVEYLAELTNSCGEKTMLSFITSTVNAGSARVVHERGNLYDVEVKISDAVNFNNDSVRITVDHLTKYFGRLQIPSTVLLKDLFPDGARHRIDVYKGNASLCRATTFFKAPYYRRDAQTVAAADFEGCTLPAGWRDTALRIVTNFPFATSIPFWNYEKIVFAKQNAFVFPGTIDSSCMMYFTNYKASGDNSRGSVALISPTLSTTGLKNKMLHFDYKQRFANTATRTATFKVQAFNGIGWVNIFQDTSVRRFNLFIPALQNNFWDTMPQRVFVPLDSFTNADFKIRFVADDAYETPSPGFNTFPGAFVAIDNIMIDAYPVKREDLKIYFDLFPNPTNQELFIRTNAADRLPAAYRIVDVTGKIVEINKLVNGRINVERLPAALYIIQFYDTKNVLLTSLKFVKV